MRKHPYIQFM